MSRPVQYTNGTVEFFGRIFATDARALIPRFETEFLVSTTVVWCNKNPQRSWSIVEIGTGSGVIAISLAFELPTARITAIDNLEAALALARENSLRHHVRDRIKLIQGDLLNGFDGPIDVLVANLPYIPTGRIAQLDPSVREFEPLQALDGGPDGLDLYRRLLGQLATRDTKPAFCIFEIDEGQGPVIKKEIQKYFPTARIEIKKDTSDFERYAVIEL